MADKPRPKLEAGAASLHISCRGGKIIVAHGTDKTVLLQGDLLEGGWDELIHTILGNTTNTRGAMNRRRKD